MQANNLQFQPLQESSSSANPVSLSSQLQHEASVLNNAANAVLMMENLQRAAAKEACLMQLKEDMNGCFLPPVLGIECFTVEKQFFNDTFLREEQYRKLPQHEKESYKTAFKQTHVLELFGSCGYMSSNITLNDKHYKLFHWSGFYAAKWAYRFAKNVDKMNKITILPGDGDTTYRKIRCPPVLHHHLVKNFE